MRDCTTVAGTDVLQWRRQQLARGGTAADLDWLLDLAAGLRWASLQRLLLDPTRTVALEQSLEVLSELGTVTFMGMFPSSTWWGSVPGGMCCLSRRLPH